MTNNNQALGLKSLTSGNPKKFMEDYIGKLKLNWYFDKWYEKVILVISFFWLLYSIGGFLWKLL